MEVNDGYYVSPVPPWVYWEGQRGVVSLIRWYRTDSGWWAWIRWVEPLIIDGVSRGGMHVEICVPASTVRPSPKITAAEYDRVHREEARTGRGLRGAPDG